MGDNHAIEVYVAHAAANLKFVILIYRNTSFASRATHTMFRTQARVCRKKETVPNGRGTKSYQEKVYKLIIVTGKGIHSDNEKDPYVSKDLSILKYSIPEFVKNNGELMSIISEINEANIEDGGSGAFYIYLKKNNFKE